MPILGMRVLIAVWNGGFPFMILRNIKASVAKSVLPDIGHKSFVATNIGCGRAGNILLLRDIA